MGGFIRILLIALLVWYGIKFIVRFVLPLILSNTENRRQQTIKKEGDVTVHLEKERRFEQKEKKGDYVDYEEVE